jgi:SurA-like N-terminal domain
VTSRRRLRHLAGLAVVGALIVSGCTFHPGSAAVVNGNSISQSKVDDLVLAACSFEKGLRVKGGETTPGTSVAVLREAILQALISFQITDRAATELKLTVSPAVVAKAAKNNPTIPANVDAHDRELLTTFFNESSREQVQEAVIGAHLKDPSVTTADRVTGADVSGAAKYLATFTKKQSVVVNPAFGTWRGGTLATSDGSLSVPVSPAAKKWEGFRSSTTGDVTGLPPNEVCG